MDVMRALAISQRLAAQRDTRILIALEGATVRAEARELRSENRALRCEAEQIRRRSKQARRAHC